MKVQPKYFLYILVFCFTAALAQGQKIENGSTLKKEPLKQVQTNDLRLRWYPLGLVNTSDMNITFGVEYVYAPKRSLALDAGYIFGSFYGSSSGELVPATGWILKLNHRWFLSDSRDPVFIEAEAAYKSASYKGEKQWVGRGVVAGVPAYEELMQLTSKKEVFTLNAKFGQHLRFSPEGHLGFEWNTGLGIRYRNYYPDLPDDAVLNNAGTWGIDPWNYGSYWIPDIQVNLRLTWQIR